MLFRLLRLANVGKAAVKGTTSIRKGHHAPWTYRSPPTPPSKASIIQAEVLGGMLWWWVLWHLWHDYGHIIGEFPYPDSSKWTDEELGIPPDDDDD